MVLHTTVPTLTATYTGLVNGDTASSLTTPPTLTTTAHSNSPISGNPYPITVSGAADTDYSISYVNGTLTVINQPATSVTMTVSPSLTSIYGQDVTSTAVVTATGDEGPTPTGTVQFQVDGSSFGSPVTMVNGSAAIDLGTGLQVGTHTITAFYSGDHNYASNSQYSIQTVTPAALTITTLSNTKPYGAALPTLAASYTGFVNGDTSASLTAQPVLSTTATAHSPVSAGPYTIIASAAADIDYTISYVIGALTVTPVALSITASNQTKVYGAALPTLTATYSGFVNGDSSASLTTEPTLTTTATAASSVTGSPYTITASGAVDSNYSISYASGILTVTSASLTITANNQTKAYGAALPTLTVSYSGFVNGDTAASLTTLPTVTTTATAASHVSGNPYSITASGASDAPSGAAFLGTAANYNIYVSGNMSENGGSAASSVAVGGNASITQFSLAGISGTSLTVGGNLNSTGTQIFSGNAQVAGTVTMGTNDNAALASGTTLFYGSNTGNSFPSFPIFNITHATNGGISSSLFSGANASLTSASSVLASQPQNGTVTFAFGTLTLTGSNTTTNYFNISGANLASTSSMQINVPTGATVFINVSGVTDQFSGANISITGTSSSKVLFNFYQATSITLSGIELKGSLLAPAATLFASGGQTDGNVMVAGISVTNGFAYQSMRLFTGNSPGAADYTISYVAGALTVTPVALTITAVNQTSVYGAALPALAATYAGFVNGDTAASLTTQPTLSTTAVVGSHVSNNPYAITASGAADSDYTISYAAGTLTVTQAPLTITAVNKSKVYGAVLPPLSVSYTGLVNGDTAASFTILPIITTTATNSSHVAGSPYSITASGAVDADYSISYVGGTLTVTPAALTITARNATKAYGAAMPTLTASYSGFVNGDTSASLTTQPTLSSTATASSHVTGSPYVVTATGAVDGDYSISYVAGTLTVTPVALVITANDQSNVYGAVAAHLDGELQRPGQWRHRLEPYHAAGAQHHRDVREPRLGQPIPDHRQRCG